MAAPERRETFVFGASAFYFLRHGETYESEAGILQGQDETELSAEGRRTAERAAEALSQVALGAIYASPLKRTMRTAKAVSLFTGVPVHALPGLMERHWGAYQGRPKHLRPAVEDPPGVESLADFEARVLGAMRSISGPSPILVVAHSGVFRVLCRHAGVTMAQSVSVASGQVVCLSPAREPGQPWRFSAL